MKKIYLILCMLAAISFGAAAQTTVTFVLDTNSEDATIDNYNPSGNYPNEIELASRAWTISSTPVTWRSLFRFNLSCIPPNATVTSADLSLFYASTNGFGNEQHSSLSNSNESLLQRVTSAWSENAVTWNNQPTTTPTDQVTLLQSISGTQDYPNMNVTSMVQQMVSNPAMNFGFMLHLTTETAYASMLFASGDNPVVGKRPALSITYTVPVTDCFTLRLDNISEDATVDNYNPGGNYPNEIEYTGRAWTISSTPVVWRSFFKFDLPCDLTTALVQSAHLSLYYPPVNGFGNDVQSSLSSSNESVLQRVTSPWTENTVNWNNQPTTTSTDEVILLQSVSPTQDYTNLDVTAMVQQMLSNPAMNYGFGIHLTNETAYAQMFLASGDNPDTSKHPHLQICYTLATSVNETTGANYFSVSPNPATNEIRVQHSGFSVQRIEIFNVLGEKIFSNEYQTIIDVSEFSPGIYFVKVRGEKEERVEKFVKE